jgi:hypothetical protein
MKMSSLAVILAALALPAAAQSTAQVEPQPSANAAHAPSATKSAAKPAKPAKPNKAHHKAAHKTHKKKPTS